MASVYGYALALPVSEDTDDRTADALRGIGFERGPRAEAVARLQRWNGSKQTVLFFEQGDSRLRSLPGALARALDASLWLVEVELTETGDGEEDEIAASVTTTRVDADGSLHLVGSEDDMLPRAGELLENLGNALRQYAEAELEGVEDLEDIDPLELVRLETALSPRLQQLATSIATAGSWTVAPQGDRWMARVDLPDGTRRMSVLTRAEVDAVSAEVGLPPVDSTT